MKPSLFLFCSIVSSVIYQSTAVVVVVVAGFI